MRVSNKLIKDVIENDKQNTFLRGHLLLTIGQYHPMLSLAEIRKALVQTIAYIDGLEGKENGDDNQSIN